MVAALQRGGELRWVRWAEAETMCHVRRAKVLATALTVVLPKGGDKEKCAEVVTRVSKK